MISSHGEVSPGLIHADHILGVWRTPTPRMHWESHRKARVNRGESETEERVNKTTREKGNNADIEQEKDRKTIIERK